MALTIPIKFLGVRAEHEMCDERDFDLAPDPSVDGQVLVALFI